MAKRAKTVFKTEMVAHVWAQQNQEHGRNHGNFYFRGPTIFSYGSHFPIARFVERNGKKAVLFTTRTYGNSTSKHLNHTRGALNGLNLLELNVYNPEHEPRSSEIRTNAKAELKDAAAKVLRSRAYVEYNINACQWIIDNANAPSKFYAWGWRLKMPKFDEEKLARIRANNALAEERHRVKRAQEEERRYAALAERRVKEAEQYQAWLRSEPVQFPYSYYGGETLLRVYGELVQTSRGAEVPVEHAKRLWPIIEKVRARGEPYVRNGHTEHVGHFTVDRIDVTGDMKVGCHFIKYDQVQKIARELQLMEQPNQM